MMPGLGCSVAPVTFPDQEPMSPASVGGFFTDEILRKPRRGFYLSFPWIHFSINICWININTRAYIFQIAKFRWLRHKKKQTLKLKVTETKRQKVNIIIELTEMAGCDYLMESTSCWAVRKGFY